MSQTWGAIISSVTVPPGASPSQHLWPANSRRRGQAVCWHQQHISALLYVLCSQIFGVRARAGLGYHRKGRKMSNTVLPSTAQISVEASLPLAQLKRANVARPEPEIPKVSSTTVPAKCKGPAALQLAEPVPGGARGCGLSLSAPFGTHGMAAAEEGCAMQSCRTCISTLFVELMLFPLFVLITFKKPLSSSALPSANSALNALGRVISHSSQCLLTPGQARILLNPISDSLISRAAGQGREAALGWLAPPTYSTYSIFSWARGPHTCVNCWCSL